MSTENTRSLTIVIPTRERSDTLLYSIKTCVLQDYENLTILVADNFSKDDTAAVVKSFSDKRIHYINSGRRLSMSANWEFALSQVTSEYVMFLGDDDGVLPGAVSALMALVGDHQSVDAVTWPSVEYGWPSCQNSNLQNTIVVPLSDGIERRRTSDMLSEVIRFKRPYSELPFIYKGLIRMEVVKNLRAASGGTVFHSMIPDIYFGISSCAVIDTYLYSSRPYTVNGASSHSNGTATFSGSEEKEAERMFLEEDNIPFHPRLSYCPSIPILVTESFLQARECLPILEKHQVNIDAALMAAIAQLERAEVAVFKVVVSALQIVSQRNLLQSETIRALNNASNRPFFSTKRVYGEDLFHKRLIVNCSDFNVKDCCMAAMLAEWYLKLNKNNQLSTAAAIRNSFRLIIREMKKRTGWFQ